MTAYAVYVERDGQTVRLACGSQARMLETLKRLREEYVAGRKIWAESNIRMKVADEQQD